MNTITKRS